MIKLEPAIKVIRKTETKNFMEGDEYCKLYIENENIVFGLSIIHPGQRGDVDPGHEDAYEAFYVIEGRILCFIPSDKLYEELEEGDLILIPPKKPHQLINVGEKIAKVIWAQSKLKK